MGIDKEINRAVKRISALDKDKRMTESEENDIIFNVKSSLENSNFNFNNTTYCILNQSGGKRFIKKYEDLYSVENILCQCIKQILDRVFKVRYPNRNKIIRELFDVLAATIQMSEFTIVKFDFKHYFNSVSSIYVFEKYLKHSLLDRQEIDLIKNFVYATEYSYAGLCTSNVIAEIIAKHFDEAVRQAFINTGLIYYERYVDDSILILNENIEEDDVKKILNNILLSIFHDNNIECKVKCTTKFKKKKFRYISSRNISKSRLSIDFLGYEFWFESNNNKIKIQYGITEEKRKKYADKIEKIINEYANSNGINQTYNLELLRHKIAAFSSRQVYITKHFRSYVWKVKGFISNYGELRNFLYTDSIEEDTEFFLKNMIDDAFEKINLAKPYFLKCGTNTKSGYNLYENMKKNKTLLLVDNIGYDYKSLVNLCKKIGISNIDSKGKRIGYDRLVREYLIKIGVGY